MPETTVNFAVSTRWWDRDGDPERIRAEAVKLFSQYLESPECPFQDDYAPGGHGGYDGPFVLDVKVEEVF